MFRRSKGAGREQTQQCHCGCYGGEQEKGRGIQITSNLSLQNSNKIRTIFPIYSFIKCNQLKMTSMMTTVLDQETEEAQEHEFLWNVQRRVRIQGEQFLPILRAFQHFLHLQSR